MELFIYLQTLPFLKYIDGKSRLNIERCFYFRPILSDAYCLFKLDKNIITLHDNNIYDNTINSNANNNSNSNIRLDIVIAVDIKHKPGYNNSNNNIDSNTKEYEPALYFIFNKKYHFLVDHTLITELAAPRNAGNPTQLFNYYYNKLSLFNIDTSLPVALYKFTNITLRCWIDNNDDVYRNNNNNGNMMTNSDCFNKLKDVIGLMNKLLPNTIVNHKVLEVPRPYFEISTEDDSNNSNQHHIDTIKLASPPSLPYLMADKLDNWLSFLECSDNILSPSITVNGISVAAISPIINNIDNNDNDIQAYLKSNIIPSSNNKKRSHLYNQAAAHFCNSLLSRSGFNITITIITVIIIVIIIEVTLLANNYNEIKEESENRINNYLDQLYANNSQESNDSNSQPNKKPKSGYDSSDNDHSQKNLKKHDSDSTTNSNHNTSDLLGKIKTEIEVICKASQDLSILRSLPSIEF
jgi:hypothetical protein